MSKRSGKRIHEKEDFTNPKRIKTNQKKANNSIDFDAISKLILKTHPDLDTKNLELVKFLTIFDILYEKANKNLTTTTESKETAEELDSVDGVPEIIKIICKTLLQILAESLNELKLPVNIKKILIKLKKVLKVKENGENKNNSKENQSKTETSQTTEATISTTEE